MTSAPPSDQEVIACIEEALGAEHERAGVTRLDRAAYPYATSYPLEEVQALLDDGRTLRLILKDLTWERLLGDALRTKPRFLYQPRRCIQTYRRVLSRSGVGARCYGTFADDLTGRYWLLIEKVPGVELWQVGDAHTWEGVARWLARFHSSFADEGDRVLERNPFLIRYVPDFLRIWPSRALDVAAGRGVDGDDLRGMAHLVARYDAVVDMLASVPPSFIHGELYPSNVLVGLIDEVQAVWPVDWEMAGVGPPILDLAALTAGWEGEEQAQLVDAYLEQLRSLGGCGPAGEIGTLLDCCRLHYALQWLGWAVDWSPPAEHARDWVSEALTLGERLGL